MPILSFQMSPETAELVVKGAMGLSTALIIYQLVAHARRVKLIVSPLAGYLAPGVASFALVIMFALAPGVGAMVMLALGLWAYVLQMKSSNKDNERQDEPPKQG